MADTAKPVKARVKLRLQGGAATPAPPVGQVLGPQGINIQDFCKQFNAQTAGRKGELVPVQVTIFKDNTFVFVLKTTPTSELIKKLAKVVKGSSTPPAKAGVLTWDLVEQIAVAKLADLNTSDLEQAKKIIAGSARSMGIEVR